jgi:chorismate lyase
MLQIQHIDHDNRSHWLKKPISSGNYRQWLMDKGSLTARLKQRYPAFAVLPVRHSYAKPLLDESQLLIMTSYQIALIREVFLLDGTKAVVFAHSVLPRKSLSGAWLGLSHLGSKPLGERLFVNKRVKRTALRYKKISSRDALYKQATKYLSYQPAASVGSAALWARRSVFKLNRASIMVTEVFLPQLLKV